jgi:hypothetical protein
VARIAEAGQVARNHGDHRLAELLVISVVLDNQGRTSLLARIVREWEIDHHNVAATDHG